MSKRILFVRSGGGMPGIDIHVGIWCALDQFGIVSTDCAGTSAGAIVSALDATGYGAARAVSIIRNLRDNDVRKELPFWKVRIPWINHFLQHEPIREILSGLLDGARPDKALRIYAADQMTGDVADLLSPLYQPLSLVDAVLASMSIAGVFPPVQVGDSFFVDGGVAANLPVGRDLSKYDEVWLLIAAGRPADYRKRTGILTHLLRNIDFLMLNQLRDSIADAEKQGPKVRTLWPPVHRRGGSFRFDHGLIDESYTWTRARLQELKDGGLL